MKKYKGFTLIEVLIATALIGILTVAFSSYFMQTVKVDQSSKTRLESVRNLDTAGDWMILDFQSAQTVPPVTTLSPGAGSITIHQSVDSLNDTIVSYSINSNGDLCRTVGPNTSKVARNISSVEYITGTASNPGSVSVTSTIGSNSMSRNYKIGSRISNSNARLTILTLELPDGDEGEPYYQTIAAYGGTLPYTYAITAGALPEWADPDFSQGEIQEFHDAVTHLYPTLLVPGTPRTYNFTVTVTDAALASVSQAYTLTINPAMAATFTPGSPLPMGYAGEEYGPVQFSIQGGSYPYLWYLPESSPPLPAGMDLELGGVLAGIPTVECYNQTFTVEVMDACGATRSASRSVSIIPVPAQFNSVLKLIDYHCSSPTVASPVGGSFPTRKINIVVYPQNPVYQCVIQITIQNMVNRQITLQGVTLANGSNGNITASYGGALSGTTVIPIGGIATGTVTLNASYGGGPYTLVVSYIEK